MNYKYIITIVICFLCNMLTLKRVFGYMLTLKRVFGYMLTLKRVFG